MKALRDDGTWLRKKAKGGFRGYPIGTLAFYGPDDTRASKATAAVLAGPEEDPVHMQRWFCETGDARRDKALLAEVIAFLRTHQVRSVGMVGQILGCPHEQGVDYEGDTCPACPFWWVAIASPPSALKQNLGEETHMPDAQGMPATIEELFGLQGKVALVLGGGLGMGEQSSLWLARAGCDVIVADIIPERAADVAAKVRAMGRRAHEAVGDMCDPETVDRVLPAAEAALGGIDILVSIIGEAGWFSVLDTSMADWKFDQRRNLDYFFYCSQWVARSMVKRKASGAMCAIASVDGMQSSPMHGAYGAAKAGLISLVKTMAMELGPHGIRVNCVSPGIIKTPRAVSRRPAAEIDENAREMGIPLGRAGAPDEVANAVLYLVSDMARYVTGITLPMDGGWLASRLDIGRFTVKPQGR